MFISLFNTLRATGVPCSLRELLDLIAAVDKRLAFSDMEQFYFLSRAILVKDEKHYDKFDRAFDIYFKGLETLDDVLQALVPEEWLRKEFEKFLTEDELKKIETMGGLEKLLSEFKKRLEEQKGKHQKGDKWVGTGGTSPFGNAGSHPEGIRVDGEGKQNKAVKVWQQRDYKNLDDSIELGTRNIKMALRRLRKFARQGNDLELDMDDTIKSTAKNAGYLDIKMVPERLNSVKVIVMFDVGGSMDPYVKLCEELFSAIKTEFKNLEYFYFHNCIYESVWKDPVRFNYKNLDIISMSLPSSGGILLGQMLKAIEKYDISSFGHNSLKSVQLITEVERRAYADRSKYMGDPDFMDLPVYELMDDDYISERMISFSWDNATLSSDIDYGTIVSNESLETTHYSIIDKYGNSVSVTTTLNNSYGSKVFVEEGGFFLNNEMDDFSSKPGHPNFYGLIGSEANSIQPKKRMLSSMTPTIVLKDGKPSLIVGTPGGSTIITSVLQTILNVYEFNMSVSDAVSAPRFHHQWLPDVVIVEENGFTKEVDSLLRDKSYFIISLPFEDEISGMSPRSSIGAVDAIFIDKNGKVSVGPDPRGDDFGAILK